MEKILEVKKLTVSIGEKKVIDDVSFSLPTGSVTALVGESGSGKTLTSLALLNLLPKAAQIESGEIIYRGENILKLPAKRLQKEIRGSSIGMVFQEPFTSLNPVLKIGIQIEEVIKTHENWAKEKIKTHTKNLLSLVKLSPDVAKRYSHELSGGMRQRVVLAMALSCSPEILILDEPTTALDVTIQKEILDLISSIQKERNLTSLFVTHDFSVVNKIADEVCVMKDGKIIEKGKKDEVLTNPQSPYTKKLIECIPKLGDKRKRLPA